MFNIRTLESIQHSDDYDFPPVFDYFKFDNAKWQVVGHDGTGRLGHHSSQGERTLYASPRESSKLLRHRFVLFGTGYYTCVTGGLNWGTKAFEVDLETALQIMDDDLLDLYGRIDNVN